MIIMNKPHLLDCPRKLTEDEIESTDWSEYTTEEIHHLIDCGVVTNEDMVHYFNNEWWDDIP